MPKHLLPRATPTEKSAAELSARLFGVGASFHAEPTDAELAAARADCVVTDAAVTAAIDPSFLLEKTLGLRGLGTDELDALDRSAERRLGELGEESSRASAPAAQVRQIEATFRKILKLVRATRRALTGRPPRAGARVIRFTRASGRRTRTAPARADRGDPPPSDGPAPAAPDVGSPRLVVTAADLDDEGAENLVQLFRLLERLKAKRRERAHDDP